MKKIIMGAALFICSIMGASAQNFSDNPIYFVGSGQDTAYFVVDFQDGTMDTSYVWGYLFTGTTDGDAMINAIAADDINFSIAAGGGFLNDIHYGTHSGVGGTGGFHWGTWSGTEISNLTSNAGLSETVNPNEIFACSFTDFAPAIEAGMPIAAFDSTAFTFDDVAYWYGTGTDSTVLVVDFIDGELPVAFGYLSDGTVTAETMMNNLATYDVNLDVDISGGFLNQITYNNSNGLNGTNGFNWGTWSANNIGYWWSNAGVSEVVGNIKYFGCSFTNYNPVKRPAYPRSAIDPYLLSNADVEFWIGTGQDTALFVVDFNDGGAPESYVWGYAFDASQNVTAEDMMNAIAASDVLLSVNAGPFLDDIEYDAQSGLAGNPYYWSTWSATNTGNWRMNIGISEILTNGSWFGCSYEAWPPPMPDVPTAAPDNTVSVKENNIELSFYPNPAEDYLSINITSNEVQHLHIYSANGKLVYQSVINGNDQIDVNGFASGFYIMELVDSNNSKITQKFIKK